MAEIVLSNEQYLELSEVSPQDVAQAIRIASRKARTFLQAERDNGSSR